MKFSVLCSLCLLLLVITNTACSPTGTRANQENDDGYQVVARHTTKQNTCRPNCSRIHFPTPDQHRCIKNEYTHLSRRRLWNSRQTWCWRKKKQMTIFFIPMREGWFKEGGTKKVHFNNQMGKTKYTIVKFLATKLFKKIQNSYLKSSEILMIIKQVFI